jgi:Ca2+-binding EF-hand superfamily protein
MPIIGAMVRRKRNRLQKAKAKAMNDGAETADKSRPESKLTQRQKGELRACFDSFDEDGSGFL